MSTEMVLLQARMAVSEAMVNEVLVLIGVIGLAAILVLWCEYVMRRWSWIPRRRRTRVFNEKF